MERINTCRIISVLLAIWLIPALSATQLQASQISAKEVKHEVADAAEAIKDYSVDQRDQALAKINDILEDLDGRIEILEKRIDDNWGQMTASARLKARNTLHELRKQRNGVAQWYGGLKHSSAGAWKELKNGFSDAYNALAGAWKKAEKEFGAGKK